MTIGFLDIQVQKCNLRVSQAKNCYIISGTVKIPPFNQSPLAIKDVFFSY